MRVHKRPAPAPEPAPEPDANPFEKGCWCILELMGHRRLGGYVSEATIAGAPVIRIDIPEVPENKAATQFYSAGAIYCVTPTTEKVARALAATLRPEPVQRYELPALERAFDGTGEDEE